MAAKKTKKKPTRQKSSKRWSAKVTETSNAMTLEDGVFKQPSARGIAASIKMSAEQSHRRKAVPFRSAMSMLTFYINRAGKNLSSTRKAMLERAKEELRKMFGQAANKGTKRVRHAG